MIFLIPKSPPPKLEGEEFSDTFKDFVAQCLIKDPTQRPTATTLLQHPFITSAEKLPEWEEFIHEKVTFFSLFSLSFPLDHWVNLMVHLMDRYWDQIISHS